MQKTSIGVGLVIFWLPAQFRVWHKFRSNLPKLYQLATSDIRSKVLPTVSSFSMFRSTEKARSPKALSCATSRL